MSYTVTLDQHPSPCDVTELAHAEHPIVAQFVDRGSTERFVRVMREQHPDWTFSVGGERLG